MGLMFGRVQFPMASQLTSLVTPSLGKIFRGVAETIKAKAATVQKYDDVVMEDFRPVNGTSTAL